MKELAMKILNILDSHGYVGYLVGGYVRDSILNIESRDIDITTNATPMELMQIFHDNEIINTGYGSVKLIYQGKSFEITTFRKEDNYLDNRHPSSVTYVDDLTEDVLRRDFTINALCIDKDNNLIDLVGGQKDLSNHLLKTIIDSNQSFSQDALRILRAIRFASYLNFQISDEISEAIKNNKDLLKNISSNRRKMELDKIFGSNKAKEGIDLIKKYQLAEVLELTNLDRVKDYSDMVGIWAMINTESYNFTSSEKDLIEKINCVYELDNLDDFVLYKYGVYVNILAGVNKGIDKKNIIEKFDKLPIKNKDDILIDADEICMLLNKTPGPIIGKVYSDLEDKILKRELVNDKKTIEKYIMEKKYE